MLLGGAALPQTPIPQVAFETHPKDCHVGIVDATGRKVLVGIETIGDPRTVEARQAVTLLVYDKGYWSDPIFVSAPGTVYFPALAVSPDGAVWVAWSELAHSAWRIMVRRWHLGALGIAEEVSGGSPVSLQPTLAALPSGGIYVAWESGVGGRFRVEGRDWEKGHWLEVEVLGSSDGQEFRPALAVDSNGALWLAFDRATGSIYRTLARVRVDRHWSGEIPVFPQGSRAPQIVPDHSGRMWVLASEHLAGLDWKGQRYELSVSAGSLPIRADFFAVDPQDRFWFFKALGEKAAFDWLPVIATPRIGIAVVDSAGEHVVPEVQAELGYAAPTVDADGVIWIKNEHQYVTLERPYPQVAGAAMVIQSRVVKSVPDSQQRTRQLPHYEVKLDDGKTARVWWADMHNHLEELPSDRIISTWVDRLYLTSRYRDGLDIIAVTDHDWPGMSSSMFYVEQGIASVLNAPGSFLAFSGFEWSGDSQVRGRYGDRTVIFPEGYFEIPRITSAAADTVEKLHQSIRRDSGIDWPHHIGYAGNHVNPPEINPDTEPVVEITSEHGVFETYDKQHALPLPYRTRVLAGTSMQDILAAGKRVGIVGSGDSHTGLSGYTTGMFGVIAPELTKAAILTAIRQRRTFAVRGGEPIFVDFRADGHFIGDEYSSDRPARLEIKVKASLPIRRIEIIRNSRFIFSQEYSADKTERTLEFVDKEMPPAYYYVRVQQGEDGWAWTSPVWVDHLAQTGSPDALGEAIPGSERTRLTPMYWSAPKSSCCRSASSGIIGARVCGLAMTPIQ